MRIETPLDMGLKIDGTESLLENRLKLVVLFLPSVLLLLLEWILILAGVTAEWWDDLKEAWTLPYKEN